MDEVVPVDPAYAKSVEFLVHHQAFQSLSKVWHWEAEGNGRAYVVHLKSLELGNFYTQAHVNPLDAVREALQWLEKQEKDLENPT